MHRISATIANISDSYAQKRIEPEFPFLVSHSGARMGQGCIHWCDVTSRGVCSKRAAAMLNHDHLFGPANALPRQVPPKTLANEFGEVSVRRVGDELQVAAALAMGAFVIGDGENCHVGLALDGSESMKQNYGRAQHVPAELAKQFIDEGLYKIVERDGISSKVLTAEGKRQALAQGFATSTPNSVREPAVQLLDNMIRTFATGGADKGVCEVIYWACEPQGKGIEPVGMVTVSQLDDFQVNGPQQKKFGTQTHLAPAFEYFRSRASDRSGIFVFMTDGRIDDETRVVHMTHEVAARMADAEIYPPNIRCVLIGVGKEVDVEQFARIDDMAMPNELVTFDIWNSKIFSDMRDISDAWSEIFDPMAKIATRAVVYDDQGNVAEEWTDKVTALLTFTIPAASKSFELEIMSEDAHVNSLRIKQEV